MEWEFYKDAKVKSLFLHLLLNACIDDVNCMGVRLKKGDLLTNLSRLSDETGLTLQEVRTAINKLEKCKYISKKSTNKFTVVTVENYSFFVDGANFLTNKQQTNNKQTTSLEKEVKNYNNYSMDQNPKKKVYQKVNRFVNFEQRTWDFDKLEKLERQYIRDNFINTDKPLDPRYQALIDRAND